MIKFVKGLCVSVLCITILIVICPSKESAYSCRSTNNGYVCFNSYHAFGHGNYLTTINVTAKDVRYINVDSGFNDTRETTINRFQSRISYIP